MIIERLDLKAFGQFTDVSLDLSAGPRRFHLVYGPNESGKSTCMRAISSLFFGIPSRTTDNYIHGNPKMRVGAKLLDVNGSPLTVIRRKNGKSKLHEADDKTPVDESALQQMLGGIDEEAFHHRFGLSHDQLVAGGKAILDSKGELGEILFSAGAGVGQLKAVQSQLEAECKELFADRARKTVLNGLLSDIEQQRKELRELQVMPAEYKQLVQRRKEAESRVQVLADRISKCRRRKEKLQGYRRAASVVPIWKHQTEQFGGLGDVPSLDEDFAIRRREASRDREEFEKRLQAMREEITELDESLDGKSTTGEILGHESEIVSLFQEIAARNAASNDQAGLKKRVTTINRHLREHLHDLDIAIDPDADQSIIDEAITRIHVSDATYANIQDLAGEYKRLREKEKDDRQRVETLQKRLADLDDELEATPVTGDPQMIESVLSDMGPPETTLSPAQQWQSEFDEMEAECRRLIVDLGLGDSEIDSVLAKRIPSAVEVDEHENAMMQCEREIEKTRSTVDQLKNRQKEATQLLERLAAEQSLPTEQQLIQERETRDQSVQQIEVAAEDASAVRSGIKSLRVDIRKADLTVDTIRTHHQKVARRAAAQHDLSAIEDDLETAKQALQVAEERMENAKEAWNQLWHPVGVKAASPRSMRAWIGTHQTLRDRNEKRLQCRSKWEAAESKIQRSTRRLASILEIAAAAVPISVGGLGDAAGGLGEMNLEALHDVAQHMRSELQESARRLDDLKRRRRETAEELPLAEAALTASETQRQQWDVQWNQATESISTQRDQSPGAISARLQKVAKIREEKRERDIVIGRIHSIDHDNESFAARVLSIYHLLGLDAADGVPASDLANELHRRLQETKTAELDHRRLTAQRDGLQKKESLLVSELEHAVAQLTQLCKEAGAESAEQLPAIEQRSREKQKTLDELATAEKQLMMVAGGQSLEQFVEEVEAQEPGTLDDEIAELDGQLAELEPDSEAALQNLGAIKRELADVDGSDRAADLNQSIQFLTGRFEREAQKYAKLKIASMILQRSIEHYRNENESPVLKIACQAFSDLTCGRYSGLRPEYEDNGKSKLFGVQSATDGQESLVAVDHMSLGTADALYLAMRLASLEHQLSGGHKVPVVIDDCLIQLDDDRTVAALKRFSALSERTQVILFTHHEHLIRLAENHLPPDEFHLHRIAT